MRYSERLAVRVSEALASVTSEDIGKFVKILFICATGAKGFNKDVLKNKIKHHFLVRQMARFLSQAGSNGFIGTLIKGLPFYDEIFCHY